MQATTISGAKSPTGVYYSTIAKIVAGARISIITITSGGRNWNSKGFIDERGVNQ
jgi:hypothetical protein